MRTTKYFFGKNETCLTRNTYSIKIRMQNLSNVDVFIKSDKIANICKKNKNRSDKNETLTLIKLEICNLRLTYIPHRQC